eukprot:1585795-Amphidinium_carterae.1
MLAELTYSSTRMFDWVCFHIIDNFTELKSGVLHWHSKGFTVDGQWADVEGVRYRSGTTEALQAPPDADNAPALIQRSERLERSAPADLPFMAAHYRLMWH